MIRHAAGGRPPGPLRAEPGPVVATLTVNGTALPLIGRGCGTVQVAAWGAPEQVKEMLPVNPEPGSSCKLYAAVWPAVTVAERLPELTVKAGVAVPSNVMVCGELAASLVIVMVAERAPVANGANTKVNAQLAFGT